MLQELDPMHGRLHLKLQLSCRSYRSAQGAITCTGVTRKSTTEESDNATAHGSTWKRLVRHRPTLTSGQFLSAISAIPC